MKKLVWTLALALLCLSSCRDYRYRVEDSIYVPVVTDLSILDIQENCATLSFEVRETSELGVGQCGILSQAVKRLSSYKLEVFSFLF